MSYIGKLRRTVKRFFTDSAFIREQLELSTDVHLEMLHEDRKKSAANPFNRFGRKIFSQNDEDGLTLEIVRRLELPADAYFAEFGVGNGTECNSIILAHLGHKGVWIGNEELAVDMTRSKKVSYVKGWVDRDNAYALLEKGLAAHGADPRGLRIVSVDLDGNDFHVTGELLRTLKPDLFIVEYNALFPPPLEFTMDYNPGHTWQDLDNYFGCSLTTYNRLFETNGYFLVCCNLFSGSNAFFVKAEYRGRFPEVPDNIAHKYVAPFYIIGNFRKYHKTSARIVNQILAKD
ncbi:MAG TPA: hypothetical protein VN616_12820 [Puia sp.]|nr:hypothetical protein [Puia sp.]